MSKGLRTVKKTAKVVTTSTIGLAAGGAALQGIPGGAAMSGGLATTAGMMGTMGQVGGAVGAMQILNEAMPTKKKKK